MIDPVKILTINNDANARGMLSLWTVYDHPSDFPHTYVARRFEAGGAKAHVTGDIVVGELQLIRQSFEHCGMVCLHRNDGDDAVVVETWV